MQFLPFSPLQTAKYLQHSFGIAQVDKKRTIVAGLKIPCNLTSDCIYFMDTKNIAFVSSQCSELSWSLNQPGTNSTKFCIVYFCRVDF